MTRTPAISRRESELRQIEDDLRNLQRRYAKLETAARRLRVGFYVLVAVLTTFTLVAAVVGHIPALLVSVVVAAFATANIWFYARLFPELRLIDWVGWWPGYPRWSVKRSEAQAVEDMVADRLERLKKLKGN
jgi:hypothetical protein